MQYVDLPPPSMYLHKLGEQTVTLYRGLTLYLFVVLVD